MCKIAHEVFSRYSLMDGFDCIRETTGMSTTTYCIPQGQLLSFIRDGVRYDCHLDALMSVRMVTDDNGDVVLRRDFGAWGGELGGNFDNVPAGFNYGFVGGAGCRKDPATGLVYMRARWYDSGLQRFISRDQMYSANRYAYADNRPNVLIDPSGLDPKINPRLEAKYPEIREVILRIRKLKAPKGGCSRWGYDITEEQFTLVLRYINYRLDLHGGIDLSVGPNPDKNGTDVYADYNLGANGVGKIRFLPKLDDLIKRNPKIPRMEILEHVLLHELIHDYINEAMKPDDQCKCGKGSPRPRGENEMYDIPDELKANHSLLITLLDALLPNTRGLSQRPSPPSYDSPVGAR